MGNDDGTEPPFQQTPGGLQIQTPLSITAPGSHPLIGGGTEVDDVTLVLTNFLATAPASSQGGGVLVQRFAPNELENFGSFTILSDDPDGSDGGQPTVLLTGRVTGGSITALNGGDSGSVLSARRHSTPAAAIFDALHRQWWCDHGQPVLVDSRCDQSARRQPVDLDQPEHGIPRPVLGQRDRIVFGFRT